MRKTRKDFEEMAKKNSELEEVYDVLDKVSADEKKRLEYETRQRTIRIIISEGLILIAHLSVWSRTDKKRYRGTRKIKVCFDIFLFSGNSRTSCSQQKVSFYFKLRTAGNP